MTSHGQASRCPCLEQSTFAATAAQLPKPLPTFTTLLEAAQSVEISTSADAREVSSTSAASSSLAKRRMRNRVSCRKTRLKRKLQQHALQVLARERRERKEYLTQLACALGLSGDGDSGSAGDCARQHEKEVLFRDFATKSLHYALVDLEYDGWLDGAVTSRVSTSTRERSGYDNREDAASRFSPRGVKRSRLARDDDVSTHAAVFASSYAASPQASLFQQWRPLVDGLQNVDMTLLQTEERELGGGVFERRCQWQFVGVRAVCMQRDGEIAAIAVTGATFVRFHGRCIHEVTLSVLRREDNVHLDLNAGTGNGNCNDDHESGDCSSSSSRLTSPAER
ncbi:hypothetical protein BBJ28_00022580 [Nothophytophthora sp. Chile5]|nr:hypothetical protein BBJ28_00022580 [Nothophytophthora sp. Chile5]